jgi:hypothetical protein
MTDDERRLMRVDYVLKDGSRGVWDYEITGTPESYARALHYINRKLGGQLQQLVFVKITEIDVATLKLAKERVS